MHNSKAERAKLFQPFDSLRGFKDYIRAKERIIVKRKQLCEDAYMELDRRVHKVVRGKVIKLVYYNKGEYVEVEGMVSKVDLEYAKMIQIVHKEIFLRDVVEIDLQEGEECI